MSLLAHGLKAAGGKQVAMEFAPLNMPLPEGFKTVTPVICTVQPDMMLDFLEEAFGATITQEDSLPGGALLGCARVGQSMLRVNGGKSAEGDEMRAALHYFVSDVDAAYRRATAAGAKVMMGGEGEPADRAYGERSAFLEDPFGNHWFLAKNLEPGQDKTGELLPYLYPSNARGLIAFLEKAFGGKGLEVHEQDGRVMHAGVQIGDSVVEMGEASSFPQAVSLYVEDPDAAYARAIAAGATSLWEPADQAYGERTAGIVDPYGNHWYPTKKLG